MIGYKEFDRMYVGLNQKPTRPWVSGSPVERYIISAGDFCMMPDGVYEFEEEHGSYEDCEWGTRNYTRAVKMK